MDILTPPDPLDYFRKMKDFVEGVKKETKDEIEKKKDEKKKNTDGHPSFMATVLFMTLVSPLIGTGVILFYKYTIRLLLEVMKTI